MEEPSRLALSMITVAAFSISVGCSLVKSALLTFSSTKLEEILETEVAKNRLAWFLARETQILLGMSALSTLADVIFLAGGILFFSSQGALAINALVLGVLAVFIPLLVLARSIPKALARLQPEQIIAAMLPLSGILYFTLFLVIWPLYQLTKLLEPKFGKSSYVSSADVIEKEILQVVSEGEKDGVLQETERDMITAVMELKDCEVKEIMTPRIDMFCIQVATTISEAIAIITKKGFSRIPIYLENRDDIVGVLYIKDLLRYWDHENRNKLKIADLMRKPYFIPETKTVSNLLKDFQKQKIHMAVILDEYGGTAGIVTVEDIIEEIVGEIADEYDPAKIEPITYQGENVIEVDARVRVSEVNEALQVDIPVDDGYETIVGFLFSSMGRIPRKDESYHYHNAELIVIEASERRVNRVKVIKHKQREQHEGETV